MTADQKTAVTGQAMLLEEQTSGDAQATSFPNSVVATVVAGVNDKCSQPGFATSHVGDLIFLQFLNGTFGHQPSPDLPTFAPRPSAS